MSDLDFIRELILIEALLAFLLYVHHSGMTWSEKHRAGKWFSIGFSLLLAFIAGEQIRSNAYSVPVDTLTALGSLALGIIIGALASSMIRGYDHRRV